MKPIAFDMLQHVKAAKIIELGTVLEIEIFTYLIKTNSQGP